MLFADYSYRTRNYHSHWSLQSNNDQDRNRHIDVMTIIYKLNISKKEKNLITKMKFAKEKA